MESSICDRAMSFLRGTSATTQLYLANQDLPSKQQNLTQPLCCWVKLSSSGRSTEERHRSIADRRLHMLLLFLTAYLLFCNKDKKCQPKWLLLSDKHKQVQVQCKSSNKKLLNFGIKGCQFCFDQNRSFPLACSSFLNFEAFQRIFLNTKKKTMPLSTPLQILD